MDRLRIRLHGTYAFWKPGDPKPMHAIAERHGLGELVSEAPPWIGYTKALALAGRANGLLVLGVDDAGYVPSKLFSYALSGKPLLACLRADSPARRYFDEMPGIGHLLTFGGDTDPMPTEGLATVRDFLYDVQTGRTIDRKMLLVDYLSNSMARKHAELFERVCADRPALGATRPSR